MFFKLEPVRFDAFLLSACVWLRACMHVFFVSISITPHTHTETKYQCALVTISLSLPLQKYKCACVCECVHTWLRASNELVLGMVTWG